MTRAKVIEPAAGQYEQDSQSSVVFAEGNGLSIEVLNHGGNEMVVELKFPTISVPDMPQEMFSGTMEVWLEDYRLSHLKRRLEQAVHDELRRLLTAEALMEYMQ